MTSRSDDWAREQAERHFVLLRWALAALLSLLAWMAVRR